MARNKVEYHIPHTAFFTFKVESGEKLVAGDLVKITDDRTVGPAGAGEAVIGVVYSGTVGKEEYDGDKNDVVTVVINKPFVYLTAGAAIDAGDFLKAAADSEVVKVVAGDPSGTPVTFDEVPFAQAITSAVAKGDVIIAVLL